MSCCTEMENLSEIQNVCLLVLRIFWRRNWKMLS